MYPMPGLRALVQCGGERAPNPSAHTYASTSWERSLAECQGSTTKDWSLTRAWAPCQPWGLRSGTEGLNHVYWDLKQTSKALFPLYSAERYKSFLLAPSSRYILPPFSLTKQNRTNMYDVLCGLIGLLLVLFPWFGQCELLLRRGDPVASLYRIQEADSSFSICFSLFSRVYDAMYKWIPNSH